MSWTGDGFCDRHEGKFTIPANGTIVGSPMETDISTWPDYDGEIPKMDDPMPDNSLRLVMENISKWDDSLPVPDLMAL